MDLNNSFFGDQKLADAINGNSLLMERVFSLDKEFAKGTVKDIRIKDLRFLSYNLSFYKNDELLVFTDKPVFKFHFQYDGDSKYEGSDTHQRINIKEGRFELLYVTPDTGEFLSVNKSKRSVEIYFDESFIISVVGKEHSKLLKDLKKYSNERKAINNGVFITDEINTIINSINNCEYTGDKRNVYLELKMKELIIISIAFYEENCFTKEGVTCTKQSLQVVENYIKLNLKKELNITDLSLLAGINTTKFKNCFKEVYGTTVFKYITSLRIERAKMLIQQKAYTISQASYEVGYKNAQHFTVAFKKNMGYLPSELKRNT